MSIKTSDLKVGDILHDVHSQRMGNTTMRCEGHWEAKVTEVAEDGTWAMVSWNGNASRKYWGFVPYKRWPKEWIRGGNATLGRGGRTCCICYAQESDGHRETCEHPRAVAARKRAQKGAK